MKARLDFPILLFFCHAFNNFYGKIYFLALKAFFRFLRWKRTDIVVRRLAQHPLASSFLKNLEMSISISVLSNQVTYLNITINIRARYNVNCYHKYRKITNTVVFRSNPLPYISNVDNFYSCKSSKQAYTSEL